MEGFKNEGAFPKIEVRRLSCSTTQPVLAATHDDVIAVASDWDEPGLTVPRLDINDIEAVADFIESL